MIRQLFLGSAVITAVVLIDAGILGAAARAIDRLYATAMHRFGALGRSVLIIAGVLFVLLAITVDVWLWALVLYGIDALASLEAAVYFSLVAFTTLGFGDIVLGIDWRILSGMIAANGLLFFGWSTAFMVELVRKLRGAP